MRILLVDDDELLTQQLADFLGSQHYAIDVALDGESGWDYAQAADYDLIVLDVNLPKLNGIRLCQQLRQSQYSKPILLLTAQGDTADKVVGLDAGADDYLVKPCTLNELSARIRALLRRSDTLKDPVLRSGNLCLNPSTFEVTYHGQPLSLSPKEYGLLELFLRHPQQVFSSASILDHLWNFAETPGEETVRTHIKRLRRKLKAVGADTLIDTVYGMGYRLQPSSAPSAQPAPSAPSEQAALRDEARKAAIALWDKFKAPTQERITRLEQAVIALESGTLSEALRQQAVANAHKLAGSLGMFGFATGSDLSRTLEQQLKTAVPESASQLQTLIATLQQVLQSPPKIAAPSPPESPTSPRPVSPPALSDQVKSPHPVPSISPTPASPGATPITVLAVDDDVVILDALQTMLCRWAIKPFTLSDPRQIWRTLAEVTPDLLILDVDMPELNGIDLCQMIRNHDHWKGLPILFLTTHRAPDVVLRLYNVGADDYVAKPFTDTEVVTRIFNRINRHRLLQTWQPPAQLDGE